MRKTTKQQDNEYRRIRKQGKPWTALSWSQIMIEAELAIGKEDALAWEAGMKDILEDPFFIDRPMFVEFAAKGNAERFFPHVFGHTWVSPHPEAYRKLGHYQVWRPQGDAFSMEEVQGEAAVRVALAENGVKKCNL